MPKMTSAGLGRPGEMGRSGGLRSAWSRWFSVGLGDTGVTPSVTLVVIAVPAVGIVQRPNVSPRGP